MLDVGLACRPWIVMRGRPRWRSPATVRALRIVLWAQAGVAGLGAVVGATARLIGSGDRWGLSRHPHPLAAGGCRTVVLACRRHTADYLLREAPKREPLCRNALGSMSF